MNTRRNVKIGLPSVIIGFVGFVSSNILAFYNEDMRMTIVFLTILFLGLFVFGLVTRAYELAENKDVDVQE